jgi:hypothetical protein
MHKLKEILLKYSGQDWKTLAFPVLLIYWVYNNNCHFFTVELKVTKTNKVIFSPHQIAFHVKHPLNTFILVLDACLKVPKLYEGSCIRELVADGLKLEPRTQGWINSEEFLSVLGA